MKSIAILALLSTILLGCPPDDNKTCDRHPEIPFCLDTGSCLPEDEACTVDDDCCSELVCNQGVCDSLAQPDAGECLPFGAVCFPEVGNCCPGNICEMGEEETSAAYCVPAP